MAIKETSRFFCFIVIFSTVYSQNWRGRIVFEDNFDGNSLDLNKWEYQLGCNEDYGPRNLQCYKRNNVQVKNGHLVITAKKEKDTQQNISKDYTSGRIRQRGNGNTYGAYVVRARLARGDHLWPAIWTLGKDNKCRYEEIDIAEYRGQASLAKEIELTPHWGRAHNAITSTKGKLAHVPFDLAADFHEYAVLWLPSKMEWYIDRQKYHEVSLTDPEWTSNPNKRPCDGKDPRPFSQPAYFIFNLGVGGTFFNHIPNWNPNTWSKPTMEIDWVRVYQE